MATPSSFLFEAAGRPQLAAKMPYSNGDIVTVTVSPGCEIFIGRFALVPEFRNGDGVIRFGELSGE